MNSSMCQEVVLTNGSKHDYSIGTYDPSNTYKVEGMFLQSPSQGSFRKIDDGGGTNSSHLLQKNVPFPSAKHDPMCTTRVVVSCSM